MFVFLLEEVDIYRFREYFVLTEKWTDENISIHIFQHDGGPVETYELKLAREEQVDDKVCYRKNMEKNIMSLNLRSSIK